ncbi:MAG: hypothetical protein WBG81_06610 [Rhodanobacter sp.]|jgi:hypothetical protein|uniref:hypothetical protein n=1 Tax=Rhodanobacter sp. KK11 TaxID=3083255 RepID=UPI0029674ED1|nr:hypothetical protein [Rhodanobacter sp. KK11]MDW2982556.1 hypothetical protein [Rhodanobacter sp. KK11]
MIELEIQGLSENREGLLVEVGRFAIDNGFTLLRQRLVQDHHGILLTMIVRGPSRKRRALEAALDACERFISVKVFPFVEGDPKPHFAESNKRVEQAVPAIPSAAPARVVAPPVSKVDDQAKVVEPVVASAVPDAPEPRQELPPEPEFEFILPTPRAPVPTPTTPVAAAPFVELVPLEPDEAAVEKMLRELEYDYPRIVPQLLALQRSVAEGARESSLGLAGQRTGGWVFEREYALDGRLDLHEAIERIGVPALRALVEVDRQGGQLHIHDSPLCTEDGRSGCSFFSGFLEGLLGPAIVSGGLSIFPVCCRSYGADECVLAISD